MKIFSWILTVLVFSTVGVTFAAADITRPFHPRDIQVTNADGEIAGRKGFWVGGHGTFVLGSELRAGDVVADSDVQIAPVEVVRTHASVAAFMTTLGADRIGVYQGRECVLPGATDVRDPDARCQVDDGVAGTATGLPGELVRNTRSTF